MKKWLIFIASILSVLGTSSDGFAAGFRLPEQGVASLGMASAFVGQADDPSAVWYNPAAITQLDGTRIYGGVIAVHPVLTHETIIGTTDVSNRETHLPVHFYATHKLNDRFALGLGINNPFGLATDWAPTSLTRAVATFSKVVTTEVNPNVAYQLSDHASVAVGFAYFKARATLENIPSGTLLRVNGDGDGWGANAAFFLKATKQLNLGLSYRSRIKVPIDGSADLASGAFSNGAHSQITFPDILVAGLSYRPTDRLTLNADLDFTFWSTYDRLVIESNTFLLFPPPVGPTTVVTQEKQWKDVWCIRLGGQYALTERWKLRAGYLYDKNPVPSAYFETRLPDTDRQGISLGAGLSAGKVTVDGAFMYLRFNSRTINDSLADGTFQILNGKYKSDAYLAGLSVGYKF